LGRIKEGGVLMIREYEYHYYDPEGNLVDIATFLCETQKESRRMAYSYAWEHHHTNRYFLMYVREGGKDVPFD
jgi:hypothetical protein